MVSFWRLDKKVGESVLKKYKSKCTECGSIKDLCVHHVERMSPDDQDYNNDDNLILLCRSCHMSYHRKAGHIVAGWNGHVNKWGRRGKGNPEVTCVIEGCDIKQHGRNLCKKHYEYFRRRGWKEI